MNRIKCWCGQENLIPFSPLYKRCEDCGTLVLIDLPQKDLTHVTDDENDLYGKNYYLKRLVDQYGYPTIENRARYDLSERCLYWLRTLMKYKLPPAKVLELGSSHGGFVAMLMWAGYDVTGLELSPWLVDFAKSTFGVSMLTGPIEDQDISEGSLDAVVLMDVLEHLPDPQGTLKRCLSLLRPDGIVLIQTPHCPEDCHYEQMLFDHNPFLEQMKDNEHFFLFSRRAMQIFFDRLGMQYINFETAIFSHYDMFFAAGRSPHALVQQESIAAALSSNPGSRLILAMLDLDDSRRTLAEALNDCEGDRAARLEVIHRQEQTFSERLRASEADRAARLEVIRQQGEVISQMEMMQRDLVRELDEIKNSKAWKMTEPLRQLGRRVSDSDEKSGEDIK